MEEKIPLDPALCNLPGLSPEEVHKNILRCHHLRHRVERKLLGWLFILIDRGFFKAIHKSTPVQYVMDFLSYQDSEASEVVRVARALPLLPKLAETFEKGEISWSHVKLLSTVAKEETEAEWLAFRRAHRPGALRAEVKNAIDKGRTRPRKGTRGIPNTTVDMKFRFTLEEMEVARQALELTASEMMAVGDGKRPTPEQVLLHLSKRVLEADLALKSGEGSGKNRSIHQVIYQKCHDCSQSHILTRGWAGGGAGGERPEDRRRGGKAGDGAAGPGEGGGASARTGEQRSGARRGREKGPRPPPSLLCDLREAGGPSPPSCHLPVPGRRERGAEPGPLLPFMPRQRP